MGYLSETKAAGGIDVLALGQQVMRQGGPGSWGQLFGILRLWLRFRGFKAEEYYTYGLWRKTLPRGFLSEFQTAGERKAFNDALLMPGRGPSTEVIVDKVATEQVLAAAGLPVTRTLAAFGPATFDPAVTHLADAAAIAGWLMAGAPYPLFGKPRFDSYARGAAAILSADAASGQLQFLNGQAVPAAGLGDEIVTDYARGYLFQPFYAPHPDLVRHCGAAMASVRICTLQTDRGVEPYYAVLRIPAKSAMHDGDAFGTRIWGLIDPASGQIARLSNLRDPMAGPITHVRDPDQPFLGFTLPHWADAMAACMAAHRLFPGHGIIGWDVFLTADGPLLNEANANPGHVYQVAAARGLRNPELEPAYQRALAFARRIRAEDGPQP